MRRPVNIAVLIGILALTAFVAVVAVERVRETANRAKCVNNLKLLGLGAANYASAYQDRLPGATVWGVDLPPEDRFSWYLDVLPFLEAAPRPPYDLKKPWYSEENRAREFVFSSNKDGTGAPRIGHWGDFHFGLCPSKQIEFQPGTFSDAHYVGIAGVGVDAASKPADAPGIGIFGYDRSLRYPEFKNGTSNTLMAIETGFANGPWVASGFPTVRGLDPAGAAYIAVGGQFGGIHQSGANALFADGSVRFLGNDISREAIETMSVVERIDP